MTLGRLIRALRAEQYSVIKISWLTKIFVIGDVLSFFIQGGGGGIMASDSTKVKLGENIILGGLFFQLVIFSFFVLAAIIFHMRMRKHHIINQNIKWERMLVVLYTVSGLIMLRNILRVIEYIGGRYGPLLRVEWPIYVFDGLLMATTMVIFLVGYPTLLRPRDIDPETHRELHSVTTVNISGSKGGA